MEYEYILEKPRKVKGVLVAGSAVHAAWAHARRGVMRGDALNLDECLEQAMMGEVWRK